MIADGDAVIPSDGARHLVDLAAAFFDAGGSVERVVPTLGARERHGDLARELKEALERHPVRRRGPASPIDDRASMMRCAIYGVDDVESGLADSQQAVHLARDAAGRLCGLIRVEVDPYPGFRTDPELTVVRLGTTQVDRGAGAALLCSATWFVPLPLALLATDDSAPYYEKVGLVLDETGMHLLGPGDARWVREQSGLRLRGPQPGSAPVATGRVRSATHSLHEPG